MDTIDLRVHDLRVMKICSVQVWRSETGVSEHFPGAGMKLRVEFINEPNMARVCHSLTRR